MFKSKLAIFFIALSPLLGQADICSDNLPKSFGSVKVSSLVGVYDGDTFTVSIDGWPPIVGEAISVRVAGIDTPEIRGKCPAEKTLAKKARLFTKAALLDATVIELRNLRRDKYFRLLADVCLDGKPLTDGIIRAGLGKPYEGGTKESWCH